MPVEFLTDDEAAAYGRYAGVPSQAELEKIFFLDDEDQALVARRRGDHMKLGFALQLVTVRYVGMFLEDPLDVPAVVVDFVAGQLGIADPSCVKRYTGRDKTRFHHAWEIQRACGLKDFTGAEEQVREWVAARTWTSGDGPKAVFHDAVRWLRERDVLLPGVTTLARLVASVRDETAQRLWRALESLLTAGQRHALDQLVEVPPGAHVSDLERWRKGPPRRASGPAMIKALDQVAEIMGLQMAGLRLEDRARVTSKGGDTEYVYWASGTAHLLPRLIRGRASGPVFLSERRPGPGRRPPARDICPHTGRARLGYDRARILLDKYTRIKTSPGWDLHQLRHSAATHLGEANAGLQLIMAKGRWRNPRTAMRYVKPGAVALAEVTELLDISPPRRG